MRDQDTWASWKPWSFSCGILWLSYPMPDWQFILQHDGIALLNKVLYWLYKMKSDNLFCGEIVAIVVDAYTNRKLQWLPLTRAVKGFFLQLKPAIWWTSIKHYHGFTHWTRKDSFPASRALEGKCQHLNGFCDILLQDLTPYHPKIMRDMNLLRVCRRKLKLWTYLHTVRLTQYAHNLSEFLLVLISIR